MIYDFIGKVVAVIEKPYISKTGEKKMQWDVVVEHDTSNPQFIRKVVATVWDANVFNTIAMFYGNGQIIKIACSVDAREYNGRWFNSINCFRAEQFVAQTQQAAPVQQNLVNGYGQPVNQGYQAPMQQVAQPVSNNAGVQVQGNANGGELPF